MYGANNSSNTFGQNAVGPSNRHQTTVQFNVIHAQNVAMRVTTPAQRAPAQAALSEAEQKARDSRQS
jgi:hypothetical protein